MATPSGTADNIALGSGIVYVDDVGATPTTDFGFLSTEEGIVLSQETEKISVEVGTPKVSVKEFVTAVSVTVSFASLEWNLANFKRSVVGTHTVGSTDETLDVGLDACPEEVSVRVFFDFACVGDSVYLNIWRAQTDGALELNLDPNAPHSFNYNFQVLLADTDWAGNSLAANVGLYQIHRQFA